MRVCSKCQKSISSEEDFAQHLAEEHADVEPDENIETESFADVESFEEGYEEGWNDCEEEVQRDEVEREVENDDSVEPEDVDGGDFDPEEAAEAAMDRDDWMQLERPGWYKRGKYVGPDGERAQDDALGRNGAWGRVRARFRGDIDNDELFFG